MGDHSSFTSAEAALAMAIGTMWVRLASLEPPLVSAEWPAYTNASERRIVLRANRVGHFETEIHPNDPNDPNGHFETEIHPRARVCDFWAGHSAPA